VSANDTQAPSRAAWALALGGSGLVTGFLAPAWLLDSNLGPALGYLVGPAAALLGLVLGTFLGRIGVAPGTQRRVLYWSAAAIAFVTLATCIAAAVPRAYGAVLDATVTECAPPADFLDDARGEWRERLARVTWAEPRAGWEQDASRMVIAEPGVVVELEASRRHALLELRRPWNRGRIVGSAWQPSDERRRFFVPDASCDDYAAGRRGLFWPVPEKVEPPAAWPPDTLAKFLGLQVLASVPDEYRDLVAE
jgi:hypothetical protein